MALQSELLGGEAKLEAAATADTAHVAIGASGTHVAKIQMALNLLQDAGLDTDGIYGTATANAVLAYKQKRKVINRSYQTEADNIVGKMTIAALDKEMLDLESSLTVSHSLCRFGQRPRPPRRA